MNAVTAFMKLIKLFRIKEILVFSLLTSCTTIYFEEPQPKGGKNLKSIPEKFHGEYRLSEEQDLYVNEFNYVVKSFESKKISIEEIHSNENIKITDSLVFDNDLKMGIGLPYKRINDSIFYNLLTIDTIFLSDSVILRKLKRNYVLNQTDSSGYWNVMLIEKDKSGDLLISSVGLFDDSEREESMLKPEVDLEYFFDVTKFKKIGDKKYLIAPTKREFKKLMKKGFFTQWFVAKPKN